MRTATYAVMTVSIFGVALYVLFLYITGIEASNPAHYNIFQMFSVMNLLNIGACLFFLFKKDSNRKFLVGWAALIIVFSVFSNPVFWFFRIRPQYAVH